MNKLSIVIPVYNEKNTILEIINKIKGTVLVGDLSKEIIIVDDGSTDGTRDLLRELSNDSEIKVVLQDFNQGKGAAVRTGFKQATGDYLVIQDADMEYDPAEYNKLLASVLEGKADVVYGSRFLGGESHRVLYFWHSLGNKFLTQFSNMFTDLNLSDMETCYKLFTKKVYDQLKNQLTANRFGIEPEITARVKKFRIYEVGISYSGRTYQEGKKIGWKDGFSAIWAIIKYNLGS